MQNLSKIFGYIRKSDTSGDLVGVIELHEAAPVKGGPILTGRIYEFLAAMPSFSVTSEWSGNFDWRPVWCGFNERSGQQWIIFSHDQERTLFLKMLDVDGIGPVRALSLLAKTSWRDMEALIAAGDRAAFIKLPSMGKKTGEVVAKALFVDAPPQPSASAPKVIPVNNEAVLALRALGIKDAEDRVRAVHAARPELTEPGDIVACALSGKTHPTTKS